MRPSQKSSTTILRTQRRNASRGTKFRACLRACLCGYLFRGSHLVRRAEVRERSEQVGVRPYVVSRHPSIAEKRKEKIYDVVSECPAIVRVGRRPCGIIVEDVRQKSSGDSRCIRRRISTAVFQSVREHRDEAGIVYRRRGKIRTVLLPGKEGSLVWARTAVRLNPLSAGAVYRASPQPHSLRTKGRVGQLEHNAAHILVVKVVLACELQVVQRAIYVEEERIAPPSGEKAIVPGRGYVCLACGRDGCSFDDRLPVVPNAGGLLTLNTAQCSSLGSVLI